MICALMLATASSASADSAPPASSQRPVQQSALSPPARSAAKPPPRSPAKPPPRSARNAKAVAQPDNEPHRQLAACFDGAVQRITMIVSVAYDGTKLRSSVTQSARATKQIEACVVDVFDHISVRLPSRPVTIELPVEYAPLATGA